MRFSLQCLRLLGIQNAFGHCMRGIALGVQTAAVYGSDITFLMGPGEGRLCPLGNLIHVAELAQTGIVHQHGTAVVAPQDGYQLFAGYGIVGAECTIAATAYIAFTGSPADSFGIFRITSDIRVIHYVVADGLSGVFVHHHNQFAAGQCIRSGLGFGGQQHQMGGVSLTGIAFRDSAVPGYHIIAGLDIGQRSRGVRTVERQSGVFISRQNQAAIVGGDLQLAIFQ